MNSRVYDIIGVGVGPFNLGLACLTQPIEDIDGLFLERNDEFNWHAGMLLENATLQTPFLCDLVTLADPTSEFSFLNYLKRQGRIYSFYSYLVVTENFFLLRNEFNRYCQWAAAQLDSVMFSTEIEGVDYHQASGLYQVVARNTKTGEQQTYWTRRLILGSGMTPAIPDFCADLKDELVHTSTYMANKDRLRAKKSITIVGSGQSAAEVYYDLLKDIDRYGYTLNWMTRSPRFTPMELTKFTLQHTSPDYTDYFYTLPTEKRARLVKSMKDVYGGINASLINDIFDLLYRKRFVSDFDTTLMTNTELSSCDYDSRNHRFNLRLFQREEEKSFDLETEAVIMATGYRFKQPEFVQSIADRINWRDNGRFAVARNCSVDLKGNEIFVQSAEPHADSFIPPDLGQACYRNSCIIKEILGREYYPIERSVAFQRFGAPETAATQTAGGPVSMLAGVNSPEK
ncbi:alcaligin biosynthesis protein [Mesorhizobium sp. Root554]|uniref:lysine N(6)-hydroxylase/L-ornithine N(5)-oxygenase family protein n=1 Tax=unclassified Mesorhizobium TaxID=325217 RepID=UPI0006F9B553|nr:MULTISPECIES: SidA/IucD/PvdA family monooxygenase [unclassified Mesorhizobium]KQZ15153.1 alcaligin biosynthesis protein [Mesorhizobium sp. Root1471]KQZ37661.1 alcaligin biosynthesis protein [Mesorhizobium sp. Root554]